MLIAIDFFHDLGQERTQVVYSGIVLLGDGKRARPWTLLLGQTTIDHQAAGLLSAECSI